ncbi:hypothetical protein Golob_006095 [Gossypium lobatum]|uniref:Uncharacterized protein n=1 Tax=Gossypium lobatum TaxID=34289 RepID=A0A7J8MVE4_9ROSI|nr:hypothetical protein [Gossypium lobatum]
MRFKKRFDEEAVVMAVDSNPTPNLSWKDKLLGGETRDVSTTMVNGIPTIAFSDRNKNKILFKEMKLTVVLKLLG